jgi:rRNA-processing protein FCF1
VLVTPLPGVDRRGLRAALRDLQTSVGNLRSSGLSTAYERLRAYLDWANDAIQTLSYQISAADVDRLIRTKGYETLLLGLGRFAATDDQRVVNGLLQVELEARVSAFEAARDALDRQIERWSTLGRFVVLDTSVYINHPEKFEEMDFARMIGVCEEPIHILVPIVIVDELDGLKQNGRDKVRWRAGYTLAILDRVLQNPTAQARLREQDFSTPRSGGIPRGEITIELVFDQPGHVRLPINDDEIIDRVAAIQPLAGRDITVVTFDTGFSMRARQAGLVAIKLAQSDG